MTIFKNPLQSTIEKDGQVVEEGKAHVITNRGSMSTAMTQFNLGVISPVSWVGEEVMIPMTKSLYSVVAESQVTVLKISRNLMVDKLPKEFFEIVQRNYEHKKQLVSKRITEIQKASEEVYMMDGKADAYKEVTTNIE